MFFEFVNPIVEKLVIGYAFQVNSCTVLYGSDFLRSRHFFILSVRFLRIVVSTAKPCIETFLNVNVV